MSYRTRWTILITTGGLITAAIVWAATDSAWWGLVGIFAFGAVFNALFNRAGRIPR